MGRHTLFVALDAPTPSTDTQPPSGLIPESPPSLGFSSSRQVNDQQLLIEALLLRLNQQNNVIKEHANVIGKLAASSGCASNDDVSQQNLCEHQAATQPLMEPTSPEPHSTGATPMLVLQPRSYGLKLSSSIWYNTMMETLSP